MKSIKVTVHVGTDQNIKIKIFAEYEYTLNELLVKKMFFNTSAKYDEREFLPVVNCMTCGVL